MKTEMLILLTVMTAFALSWLVQPHFRSLGFLTGIVDHPGYRRTHREPVPRTGGMAIFISFFMTLYILDFFILTGPLPWTWLGSIGSAGLAIMALGVGDDRFHIHAEKKLYGQLIVVLGLMILGERLEHVTLPLLGTVHLGGWAWPITLVWYLGFVNSMNLIDGLDGLASGIAIVAGLTATALAIVVADTFSLVFATALTGATMAFLYWNVSRLKIFLGDSGSMWLGLALGGLFMHLAQRPGTPLLVLLAPMVVPIWDTGTTIIRRYRKRTSIFEADDFHLHHRLVRLEFKPGTAVMMLLLVTVGSVCFALSDQLAMPWLGLPALACWLWPLRIWANRRRGGDDEVQLDFFTEMLFVIGLDDRAGLTARTEPREVAEIIDLQAERTRVANIMIAAAGGDDAANADDESDDAPEHPASERNHVVYTSSRDSDR